MLLHSTGSTDRHEESLPAMGADISINKKAICGQPSVGKRAFLDSWRTIYTPNSHCCSSALRCMQHKQIEYGTCSKYSAINAPIKLHHHANDGAAAPQWTYQDTLPLVRSPISSFSPHHTRLPDPWA